MKWIGQLIYDQIARFRDDIYLEGISTSTETDMLVVDSNNKVSKRAVSGLTVGTASNVEITDSTADASYPVVFNNEVGGLRDDTGAFFYNPSTGTLTTPNLTVSGTTTTINTTNLNVEDKNIILNYNASSDTSGTADGAGITIQDAVDASNDASLTWTAADDTFEFSHAVEINNGASGGTSALTIDNDDVDQIALDIDADNTTANIIDINAQALTHGNAIFIDSNNVTGSLIHLDVDDAYTQAPILSHSQNPTKLINIDYDKSGVTDDSGVGRYVNALDISMVDAATNHINSANIFTGINIEIDAASNQGGIRQRGVKVKLTDADTSQLSSTAFWSITEDGGTDFLAQSSADTSDYFDISTSTNGATTLTTVDADAVLAHFTVKADGIINLQAEEDYRFYNVSGGTVNTDDFLKLTIGAHGSATFETADVAAAAAHIELAADGDITLDAAGDIALEATDTVTIDADDVTIDSTTNSKPSLTLTSLTSSSSGPALELVNTRAASTYMSDGDNCGRVRFKGFDAGGNLTTYGQVESHVISKAESDECGSLTLDVANNNALLAGLHLFTESATSGTVNANIGYGTSSVTTVAGTLTMGSTATLNNTGEIQVASQPNITTLAGVSAIGTAGTPITITSDAVTFQSASADDPMLKLINTTNDDEGARLIIQKMRADDAVASGQNVGEIVFRGQDDGQADEDYAQIIAEIDVSTHGQESGKITHSVAAHDGGNHAGLILQGGSESGEVDVTVAKGANSLTTIAGDLSVTSEVGIGTSSPEAMLHLESAGDTAIIVRADVGNSGEDDNPLIHLQQDFVAAGASGVMVDGKLGIVGNAGQIMSNSIANSTYITAQGGGSSPNVSMQFGTGGNNGQDTDHAASLPTARMTILHGGNVGIGVNDPDSLLEIYGTSTQLKLSNNANDYASFAVGTHGNLTITTVDAAATAAHIELAADGNIVLDAAGDIALESGGADVTSDAQNFTISNGESSSPNLKLQSKKDDTSAAFLTFDKNRFLGAEEAGTADGDRLGTIQWNGTNNVMQLINYANIIGTIAEVDDTDEAGKLTLEVAASNGSTSTMQSGLVIEGDKATRDANVTIGNQASCTTTVAGNLTSGNLRIGGASDTSNNWITIDAQDGTDTTGGGICFYETGTDTIGAPQYGAKIVYNEDDDEFAIGTMQNSVFQRQIYMKRAFDYVYFADAAFVEGTTPTLALSDTSTTVADTDVVGTIYWTNADDGSTTARIQAVATEDHASGANGGTKIEFKTTPNTTSAEVTALTIGQDQSLTVAGTLDVSASGYIKGQLLHVNLAKGYIFMYQNTQNYWYSNAGYSTTTGSTAVIASHSNLSYSGQAAHCGYQAQRACKVKQITWNWRILSSYFGASDDMAIEFGVLKWTPGDDSSSTVAVTDMTITDHNGNYRENKMYNKTFTVTDNADATLAAGDCFNIFARCTNQGTGGSTVRNFWYGNTTAEIQIT